MALRCRSCNTVLSRRSYRPGSGRLCVNCRDEDERAQDKRELRRTLGWVAAVSLLVVVAVLAGGDLEVLSGFSYIDVPVIGVFALISVFPHELAHAFTCRLLGGQAHLIEIGRGPRARRHGFLGIDWRIRSVASTGVTFVNLLTTRRYRLRSWLVSAAGPGSHFLAAGVGIALMRSTDSAVFAWLARDFAIANGFDMLHNLWPFMWKTEHGPMRSDGASLLEIPRLDAREIRWELAGSFDAANADVGAGDDARRALARLRRIRDRDDLVHFAPAFLDAGVAWCLLLGNDDGGLLEAGRRSESALAEARVLRLDPDDPDGATLAEVFPSFEGIRGCALIELGEVEAGTRMVLRARRRLTDRHLEALYTCFVALGAERSGNARSARGYGEAARKLDRYCSLLARLEAPS